MEKVLQRTVVAKRRAQKRVSKVMEKTMIRDRAIARTQRIRLARERYDAIAEEKHRRKERWELGPLAPHYDRAEWGELYGAWSQDQLQSPIIPKMLRTPFWYIRQGDRVCVMEGHPTVKGKIGRVEKIDEERETVTVGGINKITVENPSYVVENARSKVSTSEAPIPLSKVRLVAPLKDPVTGVERDCIISKMTRAKVWDKEAQETAWIRIVQPQGIRIPWPEKEDKSSETQDRDADTLGFEVSKESFHPTLLSAPMPETVIDELRNQYSSFRTHHTEEYEEMKREEDRAEAARRGHSLALKPRGAKNMARQGRSDRLGSEPQPEPQLSKDMAALIGAHMAAQGVKFSHGKVSRSKASA